MAKKKRNSPAARDASAREASAFTGTLYADQALREDAKTTKPGPSALGAMADSAAKLLPLPLEIGKGDWTAILLALMFFFTPALGVPNELMLQDTLKSIIVAFMSLGAALILFWSQRNRREAFRWHFVMWLPIMLCAYALGSMVWSHTFLAGVEAIRWFLFAVIVWLVLNSASRERFPMLAWGVHLGALAVALLGASQFWFDVRLIPQGPNPAATFVNRNFAAEFMACTYVFSAYLLFSEKRTGVLAFLAASTGLNLLYLMMCGTRSAYVGSAFAFAMIALTGWKYRTRFSFISWKSEQRIIVLGVLFATVVGLGMIKSGNPGVEFKDVNTLQRITKRAAQIQVNDNTLNVRKVMWLATENMIKKRPLSGVGAGAWEVDIPLYQAEGSQLETDYYAHNEILQILGEYGLVGWLFMLLLIAYSLTAAWRTLFSRSEAAMAEGPIRMVALTSLLALMVVSNIGFPWRLASTGIMFALCLGLLAASDARLGLRGLMSSSRLPWQPVFSQTAAVVTMVCLALAMYITQQAAEVEAKIVQSVKQALSISASGDPNNPKHDKMKKEMLKSARESIAISPHYRKITPMLGDELAKWGDWTNATWVWESVISSRPYVVAIMSNVARGYMATGNNAKAQEYLESAKKLQPKGVSIRSLEVILLSRSGKEAQALELARLAFAEKTLDSDMMNAAHVLAVRANDFKFAIETMQERNKAYPTLAVDGYIKIANVQYNFLKDEAAALENYRSAYVTSGKHTLTLALIPVALQAKL